MIGRLLSKLLPESKAKAEIVHLRHQLKNDIQALQSGNRLMQSMSGMNRLAREAEGARNKD